MKNQELEVKFYVHDLAAIEQHLVSLDAVLVQPRTFEINLRFDTPEQELSTNFRVLRLRQDTAARMTFKGPAYGSEGVRVRQEIEFIVEDFEAARDLLEALGYQVSMGYEKYRTVYDLGEVHITLDEMPYGNFVEIEGPDPESILDVNLDLGLIWEARASESYVNIFERLKKELKLDFRDLSFENFTWLEISPDQMKLPFADK
jgi:adenylate cyclase class 2